jgi:PAS domain S-box-containing protein
MQIWVSMTTFQTADVGLGGPGQPAPPRTRGRTKLFELSSDLLATIDRAGNFTDLNPAWQEVLGWPLNDLLGTRAIELLHPDDLRRTLELKGPDADSQPDIGRVRESVPVQGWRLPVVAVERPAGRRHLVRRGAGRDRPPQPRKAR